jgi:hypothetical protein
MKNAEAKEGSLALCADIRLSKELLGSKSSHHPMASAIETTSENELEAYVMLTKLERSMPITAKIS